MFDLLVLGTLVIPKTLKRFLQESKVDYRLIWDVATGPEAFLILDGSAKDSKQAAIEFEDNDNLGRLFDIDVLNKQHGHYSRVELGMQTRKCLICNENAKECARSRKHSVAELQNKISEIYAEEIDD